MPDEEARPAHDSRSHDDSVKSSKPYASEADSLPGESTDLDTQAVPLERAQTEDLADEVSEPIRAIENLTLSELIVQFMRTPAGTWSVLQNAFRLSAGGAQIVAGTQPSIAVERATATNRRATSRLSLRAALMAVAQTKYMQLLLYAAAIVCAFVGSILVRGTEDVSRADGYSLTVGAPYLWLGFLLWLAAEVVGQWAKIRSCWLRFDRSARLRWIARIVPTLIWINALFVLAESMSAPRESAAAIALTAVSRFIAGGIVWLAIEIVYWRARPGLAAEGSIPQWIVIRQPSRRPAWEEINNRRKLLIGLATLSSLIVWQNTTDNRIEPPIIILWLASAILWGFVFAPLRWNAFAWATDSIDGFRRFRWRENQWVIVALMLILLLGAGFRFYRLDAYPPQMFSDLVEKIQDAYKIHHLNDYRIFLDNIGGREPIHFYLLSFLASQPGMEFNHYALKLMSALESFITLPIVFWLGVEVMGKRRRNFGLLFGLMVAGMVAVSFWHVMIGRQGMRISLAPLFSALTAVYLVRALRCNRRADYVKAGLALGFGLMGYQAVRMLPAAAVAGIAIAVLIGKFSWRMRASYLLNLTVLAFVSFMVFLPMIHYWTEEPENYMRRANTRLFGDMPTTDEERAAFLQESGPILLRNVRNTALIYHYYGDSTWVSAVGDEPAADPLTAAFVVLGIAAWLSICIRAGEPVFIFVPIYLFVTLLPTALALSFPVEVPSFIRASSAIPPSYLIAALPVVVFCRHLCKTYTKRLGVVAAVVFAIAVLLYSNNYNTSLYFGEFTDQFVRASHPYAQAGDILRGFAESGGAFGNAFVLTSAHWWDVRAIGIEAGVMFWHKGGAVKTLPQMLARGLRREEKYRLNPERDLLFFYSRQNEDAPSLLAEWFPRGRSMEIEIQPAPKSFFIYRVPALGADGLHQFLDKNV